MSRAHRALWSVAHLTYNDPSSPVRRAGARSRRRAGNRVGCFATDGRQSGHNVAGRTEVRSDDHDAGPAPDMGRPSRRGAGRAGWPGQCRRRSTCANVTIPLSDTYQPTSSAASARLGRPRETVQHANRHPDAPRRAACARVSASASRVCTMIGRATVCCQGQLIGEGRALAVARGVVVVIIEPTLSDGDRTGSDGGCDPVAVTRGIIRRRRRAGVRQRC